MKGVDIFSFIFYKELVLSLQYTKEVNKMEEKNDTENIEVVCHNCFGVQIAEETGSINGTPSFTCKHCGSEFEIIAGAALAELVSLLGETVFRDIIRKTAKVIEEKTGTLMSNMQIAVIVRCLYKCGTENPGQIIFQKVELRCNEFLISSNGQYIPRLAGATRENIQVFFGEDIFIFKGIQGEVISLKDSKGYPTGGTVVKLTVQKLPSAVVHGREKRVFIYY